MSLLPLLAACGTLSILPPGPAPVMQEATFDAEARDDGKLLRDAFGGATTVATSKNFALKWGAWNALSDDDVEVLLGSMERSWEVEVEQMGHPPPSGADDYLFNVYIGDSGSGAPDSYGVNYFSYDDDGWPMIVLHPGNLENPEYAGPTIGHELYHAIQAATGNYLYQSEGDARAWYWEASASWVMGEVFPEDPGQYGLLQGYAFFPHLSVEHFQYATADGGIEVLHQYGAFIFLRYLTEQVADPTLIRDSWVNAHQYAMPISELNELLLAGEGVGLDDVFGSFAAATAVWDYALGDYYDEWLDYVAPYYEPGADQRIAAEVPWDGTEGLVDVDDDLAPEELAFSVVLFESPDDGPWEVGFEGAPQGEHGTDSRFVVTLVLDGPGEPTYVPIDLDDAAGEVTVEVDGEDLYLVVAALDGDGPPGETFAYSYRFEVPEEEPEQPEPEQPIDDDDDDGIVPGQLGGSGQACTCDAGAPSASVGWLALLLAVPALRRRR